MKRKSKELDVDFIGGQGPLTKEEELSISEYIKTQKQLRVKKKVQTTRADKRKKSIA